MTNFKRILSTVMLSAAAIQFSASANFADAAPRLAERCAAASGNAVNTDITREEARRIALEKVPGTIVKEEMDTKRGQRYYEFYIRKTNGETYEVKLDAADGSVIEIERKGR